ncbi:RNA transcription, translation and transport factor protein-like [Mercenaria mercenaria]|uniref:RNA transcription, translation and transport factor protein-like n=1 Tax=Mercenaria mercenaria TaxID=6596 RepID=UPI00234E6B86|nr:RNA transcription, translation and transport factor protein-like [Mercenaria mercenaria]
MFQRKLLALNHHQPQKFNSSDENEFRSMIVWLEDQKVRHYKIEDRAGLRNTSSSDWPKALENYANDLGCPYPISERNPMIDWLLGYAVRLEYGDDAEKLRSVKPHTLGSSDGNKPPQGGASSNPLDALDFEDPDFKAGVTSLAMMLQIPPYHDHLEQLKAICIVVKEKLSIEALDRAGKEQQGEPATLETLNLGFDTGDYIINEAAKILRLLHIRDLRELQSSINQAIVAVQTITANPKTDSRLGKVGR